MTKMKNKQGKSRFSAGLIKEDLKGSKMRKLFIVLFFACLLSSSCSTEESGPVGQSEPAAKTFKKTITAGIPTEKEIVETFGPPAIITTSGSSNEIWTYGYITAVKARGGRWDVTVGGGGKFTLMIEFYKNGVVKGCGYKASD